MILWLLLAAITAVLLTIMYLAGDLHRLQVRWQGWRAARVPQGRRP